jgi:hypothetical protein
MMKREHKTTRLPSALAKTRQFLRAITGIAIQQPGNTGRDRKFPENLPMAASRARSAILTMLRLSLAIARISRSLSISVPTHAGIPNVYLELPIRFSELYHA